MSSRKQFIRLWVVIGGYMGLLFFLIIVQGILDAAKLVSLQASLVPFLVLHLILLVVFFIVALRSFNPPVYQEAQRHGQSATAQVLGVKETGWQNRIKKRNSLTLKYSLPGRSPQPHKYEYELQLQVLPTNGSPYEAKLTQFLETAEVPEKGSTVAVKIHPRRKDIVVLAKSA